MTGWLRWALTEAHGHIRRYGEIKVMFGQARGTVAIVRCEKKQLGSTGNVPVSCVCDVLW